MIFETRQRRFLAEINVIPLVDVVLVLLVIFMVTAPMLAPSQIELPSVGQAARQPDRYVQVVIDKEGQLAVRDGGSSSTPEPVTQRTLVARVKALQGPVAADQPAVPVIISADKSVKYETVVSAMDTLQRAGVARVGLSVQPER